MPARRNIAILAAVALLAAASGLLAYKLTRPHTTGERLSAALVDAGDGFHADGPCVPGRRNTWRCAIEDDPGSGASDVYRLRVGTDGCWSGARTQDSPGDQPLSGCLSN